TTEYTYSFSHLQYQLNAKVSGFLGSLETSLGATEDEETASVFMLLIQPAYRIYVDVPQPAADWVAPETPPDAVRNLADTLKGHSLGYVDQVTYGRVILVVGTSTDSTRKAKQELHAATSFFFSGSLDAMREEA